MSDEVPHPSLARLIRTPGGAEVLRLVGSDLPGADATSLLLGAMDRRCADLRPADVMSQYRRDRFVAPAQPDPIRLARIRLRALEHLAPVFEPVEVAPLAPLGSHSVFSKVDQKNVVTTTRLTDVAADPTNQLALEAALRRQAQLQTNPRSTEQVRLCAVERVTRAQVFDGPRSFAHFLLLGVVVGGRSLGSHGFEIGALADVVIGLSGFVTKATGFPVEIRLTDFEGSYGEVLEQAADRIATDQVTCTSDHDRRAGRGYYPNVCFKLSVDTGTEIVEVGDGGAVDWAGTLLQNRKERLMIGGVSLERLAAI